MKTLFSFFAGLLLAPGLYAQASADMDKLQAIRQVIKGYNTQDYRLMKGACDTGFQNNVPDEMLAEMYAGPFGESGKARIMTAGRSFAAPDRYAVRLSMEKDPGNRVFWEFYFNERNEIIGFGSGFPNMYYRKPATKPLVNAGSLRKKIDALMADKYLKGKPAFNGSIMVMDQGKAVYKNHFGYSRMEAKTPINDTTLFDLASCSKQFTAIAVLLLEQAGKLSLMDTIQKFIPDFPYRDITIHNLLTHTSGLPDYISLMKKTWDPMQYASNEDVLDLIKRYHPPTLFPPNAQFAYSNTGYVLLSLIIERASGDTYAHFLDKHIFSPLGMSRTRVYNTRRSKQERINNYAYGYLYDKDTKQYVLPDDLPQHREVIYLDAITGDGAISSCIRDLERWEQELLNPTLISSSLLQTTTLNHRLPTGAYTNYGYGFFLSGGAGYEPLVFHTGGWPGYTTCMLNFFGQEKQVVVLSNNNFEDITLLADDIAALLIEE